MDRWKTAKYELTDKLFEEEVALVESLSEKFTEYACGYGTLSDMEQSIKKAALAAAVTDVFAGVMEGDGDFTEERMRALISADNALSEITDNFLSYDFDVSRGRLHADIYSSMLSTAESLMPPEIYQEAEEQQAETGEEI